MTISLRHYAREAQRGSEEAMIFILEQFEPLVKKQARKYQHNYQSFEEAKSSIHHAAIHCIMNFDLSKAQTVQAVLPCHINKLLEREAYHHKKDKLRVRKNFTDENGVLTDLPKTYVAPREQHPEQKILSREKKNMLSKALRNLPEIESRLITCHYFKDQSYRTISEIYKIPKTTVCRIIKSGQTHMKEELLKNHFALLD